METITPVVGGGVDSHTPDTVDVVRASAVRGGLRHWWRALQAPMSPKDLHAAESRLFGGVDVVGGSERPEAFASQVWIEVNVEAKERGQVTPAGVHRRQSEGQLRSFPDWEGGRQSSAALGYLLFPLQRNRDELQALDAQNKHGDAPTHSWRTRAGFTLKLRIQPLPGADPMSESDLNTLLWATWCWIHLGGLGARTRRGLGCLKVAEVKALTLRPAGQTDEGGPKPPETQAERQWASRFTPPENERALKATLSELMDYVHSIPSGARDQGEETLAGARIFMGKEARGAEPALVELAGSLRHFRQGPGFGRDRKPNGREGRSHWPEPDMLRLLKDDHPRAWPQHTPSKEHSDLFKARKPSETPEPSIPFPRGAFGLPIVFEFKDSFDKLAKDELIGSGDEQRWASPLLFRVFATKSGAIPLAILLSHRPPGAKTRSGGHTVSITHLDGAVPPVRGALAKAKAVGGDAPLAFCLWLCEGDFKELELTQSTPSGDRT